MTSLIQTRAKKQPQLEHSVPVATISKKSKRISAHKSDSWSSATKSVNALWIAPLNAEAFGALWKASNLDTKRTFVTLLDGDKSNRAIRARRIYANVIYQGYLGKKVENWPSQDQPAYYHTTCSLENVKSILREKQIRVTRRQASGAFASTEWEPCFGNFTFVFKRSIEWHSEIYAGSSRPVYTGEYWAAFEKPIPVTAKTLSKIMIDAPKSKYHRLAAQVKKYAPKWVVVEPNDKKKNPPVVPREWPQEFARYI